MTAQDRDGIAIVGIACRFPNGDEPQQLWRSLLNGTDAIRRRKASRVYGPPRGGFIDTIETFDAEFFGLTASEAVDADPQHRLTLELAWEAVEDAGVIAGSLSGRPVGVFLGVMANDYADLTAQSGERGITAYTLTGLSRGIAANRVSYFLGSSGPSMTVDTGQSSSLVAVHLACESLQNGDTEIALAGGVHLNISPIANSAVNAIGALSPDGKCFVFDERANGYVRGEGGGVVVLKRLADARESGDHIYSVIRGSALGTGSGDGGLTVPSSSNQAQVIGRALDKAQLEPNDVHYVELHGTGTRVGDPTEAQALGIAYGQRRTSAPSLAVGSIKTNIGHLEGAAGIAGLIKAALCVDHRRLVPSLNFVRGNPKIRFEALGLRMVTDSESWPADRLAAGVTSLGIGGMCCHMIIASPPEQLCSRPAPTRPVPSSASAVPVLISGRHETALRAQARKLRAYVATRPTLNVADVGLSLATTRTRFSCGAGVIASDRDGLLAGLAALGDGRPDVDVVEGDEVEGKTAFLFSGQGAQRTQMGRELACSQPVFAEALKQVCQHVDGTTRQRLDKLFFSRRDLVEPAQLNLTELAQVALFALEVALFRLVEHLGIQPDYLIGHSVGELAAAHVAGVLSLADACALVEQRGRLMGALPGNGAMIAVRATERDVVASMRGFDGDLSLAAVNGPEAVVVSGDREALGAWLPRVANRKTRWLPVSHAFHSQQMEPMLAAFGEIAARQQFAPAQIPIVSSLDGRVIHDELANPEYWVRHIRQTVRFSDGLHTLHQQGVRRYFELGPDGVLTALAQHCVGADGAVFAAALRADKPEPAAFAQFAARVHLAGGCVNWQAFGATSAARRVKLPTYAFQRRRFWTETCHQPDEPDSETENELLPTEFANVHPSGAGKAHAHNGSSGRTDAPASAWEYGPSSAHTAAPFVQQLVGAPQIHWERMIFDLVQENVNLILGRDARYLCDPDTSLQEMGLDSLAGTELRNRLAKATNLSLPSSLTFDHPTLAALAKVLVGEIRRFWVPDTPSPSGTDLHDYVEKFEAVVAEVSRDRHRLAAVRSRLVSLNRQLAAVLSGSDSALHASTKIAPQDLDEISDDEVFRLIDTELGRQ